MAPASFVSLIVGIPVLVFSRESPYYLVARNETYQVSELMSHIMLEEQREKYKIWNTHKKVIQPMTE